MVRVTDLIWFLIIGVTWILYKGNKAEDLCLKDVTYNDEFKIFKTIIKRQLEGKDTDKWNKSSNTCMGIYGETSTGVHHLFTMDNIGTNQQNW